MEALESGEVEAAFQFIRRARVAAPNDPQIRFLMARVLGQRNRFAEAIKMLDDLAVEVPEARLPVMGQTAEWLVLQGDWDEAEKRYRTLLGEVSDTTIVDRMLSQLLIRQGRRLEAATHLRKLCQQGDLDESNLRSLLIIAHPFAGDAIKEAFEPIGALGKARVQMSQGNWDEAAELLTGESTDEPQSQALLGRIYAEQHDFESLEAWLAEGVPEAAQASADYWFAMGVYHAHQGNHRDAVAGFCETVLRDPTDQRAYRLLSESLRELDADDEAEQALARAEQIEQTQVIGGEMAASSLRDPEKMSKLSSLLDQLHRPFEALAWRAVEVAYRMNRAAPADEDAPDQDTMRVVDEVNRRRQALLQEDQTAASRRFILCGVDLDEMHSTDDASRAVPANHAKGRE